MFINIANIAALVGAGSPVAWTNIYVHLMDSQQDPLLRWTGVRFHNDITYLCI